MNLHWPQDSDEFANMVMRATVEKPDLKLSELIKVHFTEVDYRPAINMDVYPEQEFYALPVGESVVDHIMNNPNVRVVIDTPEKK